MSRMLYVAPAVAPWMVSPAARFDEKRPFAGGRVWFMVAEPTVLVGGLMSTPPQSRLVSASDVFACAWSPGAAAAPAAPAWSVSPASRANPDAAMATRWVRR